VINAWGEQFSNGTILNASMAQYSEEVMASVSVTKYALSYSSLGVAKTSNVQIGVVKNKMGNVIEPGALDFSGEIFDER
jgi:ABC-type phosphate transport system substrate-binding protein